MVKYIKRSTDLKFLKSLEDDLWVSERSDAFQMTPREFDTTKTELLKTYTQDQLREIVDTSKKKPMSPEEAAEVQSILENLK